MAERERYRIDRRAVRIGFTHGAVAVVVVLAFCGLVAVTVRPFVQLLAGALPIPLPGVRFGLGAAAFVGFLVGVSAMRGNRRLAGPADGDGHFVPGASALERARARLADSGGERAAEPRSVQRWDSGLLAGGDLRPVSDAVTHDDG